MDRAAAEGPPVGRRTSRLRRAVRGAVLILTLLFVLAALLVSVLFLVYTAWRHDLGRGLFALVFAVLSSQIAINWLLWKEDDGEPAEDHLLPR